MVLVFFPKSLQKQAANFRASCTRENLALLSQEEFPAFDASGRIVLEGPLKLRQEDAGFAGALKSLFLPEALDLLLVKQKAKADRFFDLQPAFGLEFIFD